MSHDYHRGPADSILYDGCEECDSRAANPLNGLCQLDGERFPRLWERMLAVEDADSDTYRSRNEAKLGHALNTIRILLERHPGVMHG